jgi:hypothetical protein
MRSLEFIVERHPDEYLEYPSGLRAVVMCQGNSYEAAFDSRGPSTTMSAAGAPFVRAIFFAIAIA